MFDKHILERRIVTLMAASPRITRTHRYLLGAPAVLVLSICAGVAASFTQPVAAQTQKQPESAQTRNSPNLDCTYIDEKGLGSAGTCGRDKQDKAKYVCYKNPDLTISQLQVGCEWKVLRAERARKK
jgi:hypothetical protein